ncbi:MAG: glycosyltransferase family 4 protein [candidate division Zixibacteria bacterium]|nr:glycosyltransferase family 4 protein [candidate division Zixibacteria bacterium]
MADRVVILSYAHSIHTLRWARSIRDTGFDVVVISCGGQPIEGVETIIYGKTPGGTRNFLAYTNRVRIKLRQLQPSLIHAFQATGFGLWGAVRGMCPKLLTAMGSDILITARNNRWYRWHVGSVVKKYDYFSTSSRFLRDAMIALYPDTRHRFEVIPFGTPIPEKCKDHTEIKPVRLVYMKLLRSIYGPDVLIDALKELKDANVPVRLDMFGYGSETGALKRQVTAYGMDSMVSFQGWVEPDLVLKRLMDYDIMVMPSRSESFGVAAVEAGACGLPVVASKVGGIPEVVKDGETGILVPPEDSHALAEAIRRLAEDVVLRRKMGENGRDLVENEFSWDKSVEQMVALYRRLIKSGGRV